MKLLSLLLSLIILLGPLPAYCAEMPQADKEYPIDSGDVISINVFPAQEFSRNVTVQPDGNIEIPLLGSLRARGMKPSDLQKILVAKYSRYVSDPAITLAVQRFSFSRVAIIGQVKSTGYYEYREGMRLLDLVAQAGGLQDYARTSRVRIFRKVTGEGDKVAERVIQADMEKVLKGDMEKNMLLASGDIVYIPRKPYSTASKWTMDNVMPWLSVFLTLLATNIVINER